MNKELQAIARETLKGGLSKCTEAQQYLFKRMYSHEDLNKSINDVVDDMEADRLDWAMTQVQRTLDKA